MAASNELRSSIAKDRFVMQFFAQDQQQTPAAIEFRKLKQDEALLDARIQVEKKKIELRMLQERQLPNNSTAPDENANSNEISPDEDFAFNGEDDVAG